MSTILDALRKLQQDARLDRKETDQGDRPEASETDPSFRPIQDPTALDAFVNAPTETLLQHEEAQSDEAAVEPRTETTSSSVTGLGGDWRDYQPESFSNAAIEAAGPAESSEPIESRGRRESDEDSFGEGLALAESRLLAGVADSESGVAYDPGVDDGPSIYDDTRAVEDGGEGQQRRTLLIAATALSVGLLLGFFLVRMKFQNDVVVPEGDRPQQAAVDASRKPVDVDVPRKQAKPGKKTPAPTPAPVLAAKPAKAEKDGSVTVAGAKPVAKPPVAPVAKPPVAPVAKPPVAPVAKPYVAPAVGAASQGEAVEPEVSLTVPVGAPHVDLVFIQWARNPTNRLVSIRNLKGTLLVLREGDYADPVQGMKVAHIGRESVDFSWKTNLFRISVNDF